MAYGKYGRIVNEPNLSDETLVKLYLAYKKETNDRDEALKRKHPKLFQEAKNFWRIYAKEILNDPKNAHLKRSIKEDTG